METQNLNYKATILFHQCTMATMQSSGKLFYTNLSQFQNKSVPTKVTITVQSVY